MTSGFFFFVCMLRQTWDTEHPSLCEGITAVWLYWLAAGAEPRLTLQAVQEGESSCPVNLE